MRSSLDPLAKPLMGDQQDGTKAVPRPPVTFPHHRKHHANFEDGVGKAVHHWTVAKRWSVATGGSVAAMIAPVMWSVNSTMLALGEMCALMVVVLMAGATHSYYERAVKHSKEALRLTERDGHTATTDHTLFDVWLQRRTSRSATKTGFLVGAASGAAVLSLMTGLRALINGEDRLWSEEASTVVGMSGGFAFAGFAVACLYLLNRYQVLRDTHGHPVAFDVVPADHQRAGGARDKDGDLEEATHAAAAGLVGVDAGGVKPKM